MKRKKDEGEWEEGVEAGKMAKFAFFVVINASSNSTEWPLHFSEKRIMQIKYFHSSVCICFILQKFLNGFVHLGWDIFEEIQFSLGL